MVRIEGRADRASGITCRRMDIDFFKPYVTEDFPVRDAVEPDPAGDAQSGLSRLTAYRACHIQEDFFGHCLNTGSDIGVMLVAPGLFLVIAGWRTKIGWPSRFWREKFVIDRTRITKKLKKLATVGRVRRMMEGEIVHVQPETTIGEHFEEFMNLIDVPWATVRRHPHHFVLAFIDFESQESGKCGVEQADGVRETDFVGEVKFVSFCPAHRSGCPLSDSIDSQEGSTIERRTKECAGGM